MIPISNDVRRLMGAAASLWLVAVPGHAVTVDDAGTSHWLSVAEASTEATSQLSIPPAPAALDGTHGAAVLGSGTLPKVAAPAVAAPSRRPTAPPQSAPRIQAPPGAVTSAGSQAPASSVDLCAREANQAEATRGQQPPANASSEMAAALGPTPAADTGLITSILMMSAGGVIGAGATQLTAVRRRRRADSPAIPAGSDEVDARRSREPEAIGLDAIRFPAIEDVTTEAVTLPASPPSISAPPFGAGSATTGKPEPAALALVQIEIPSERVSAEPSMPPTFHAVPLRAMPVEQLAAIAERWCGLEEPTQELFAEMDLPGKLGSLFGPRAGMVSVTGPVRSRNEDAALLLGLDNGCTLLMAADGMGGHPDGHLASRLALVGACVGLREALQRPMSACSERLLTHAFSRARWTIRRATRAGRLSPGAGTTLIATLVESDHYVTAYLGDGGAYVRRADGSVEALMVVQKVQSNVLDRYLSADSPASWRPEISRVARRRQDTVAVGSDGVMDRVDIQTVMSWLANHVATKGLSMPQAVRQLVDNFARIREEDGEHIADDNMTLLAVRMR